MLNLHVARKSKSMTQKQVAELLKVTTATYNRYEKGVIRPDPETLKKLSAIFNVSVDYLLGLPANATAREYPLLSERTLPQETSVDTRYLDKIFQEFAEQDDTEYALKATEDIKIVMQLTEILKHADEETKKAIYEYLTTSPETKKALSPVVAITQNKK